MRKYSEETKKKLISMYCNKCGKLISIDNGIINQGVFNVTYGWGYFSEKDGQVHEFDLCEECYDRMVGHGKLCNGRGYDSL